MNTKVWMVVRSARVARGAQRLGTRFLLPWLTGLLLSFFVAGPIAAAPPNAPPNGGKATPAAPPASASSPAAQPAGKPAASPKGQTVQLPQSAKGTTPLVIKPGSGNSSKEAVAVVNTKPIYKQEIAELALKYFGKDVLEGLVNRRLIEQFCQQKGVSVTEADVQAEIERTAKRFNLDLKTWRELLERERGITAEQYATEIVWPTLALRRLTASKLQVTDEEVRQAYESEFGEAVKVRMIAMRDPEALKRVHAEAVAQPEQFERLAKKHSDDVNSAASGGLIQPVRRFRGEHELEQVAFKLKNGEISPIIKIGEQSVFLKCEGRIPPKNIQLAEVKALLEERVRDEKLPVEAHKLFADLQKTAKVENIFNDPVKRQANPGVAAKLNGVPISLDELETRCFNRHGANVLESVINRRILEDQLARHQLKVTKGELDAEVARAAFMNGVLDSQGKPNVEAWLKDVETNAGASREMYLAEAVWPTAALRKLAENAVQVTEDDIQKGFEANYGPRVRVRAIVLPNQRQAQKVWAMAREKPTVEYFAELAEEYSVEAGGRSQGGIVPPIQQHGGQPLLEKEAFALKQGELSGIIQLGDKFVILLCEGQTAPEKVELAEVRDLILEDLREKKLDLAMAQTFEQGRKLAQVDNFIAGTSQLPETKVPGNRSQIARQPEGNTLR